ncbi:MAG TPA: ATP-binding protein [Bryobacteraceae bacterium]|nr:ATP-binding protein [Bryobacteraceae bacterium]
MLEESAEELYDQAPCGYVSTDPDGLILKINETLLNWTGYRREELVGTVYFSALLTTAGKIFYETHFTLLLRMHGVAKEIALDLVCKDGQRRPALLSAVQKRGVDGTPLLNRITVFDATERRRYERELLIARKRAEQASLELASANMELRRANADLEQFAYSASHDLKEPLRIVSIYVQLLERKCQVKLDEQEREYLALTVASAQRAQTLLNDLLAYVQAAHMTEESEAIEATDAGEALDRVLSVLSRAVEDANATIQRSALPVLRVREVHLVQLFQNLIANALKYRGEAPPFISVRAIEEDNWWILSVEDNGIGIDPQHVDQVFGLFKRLHASSEYPGTGIGLAICRKIVDRYGGRIWVESAGLGKGSTFYFTLPAAQSAKVSAHAASG